MTGDDIRAAIAAATPLTNPRLSEVEWNDVAAALQAAPVSIDPERLAKAIHNFNVTVDRGE